MKKMAKTKVLLLNKGFNFSQDGPGNRLVYHLQGCNFRCPWCSNPESMAVGGTFMEVPKSFDDKSTVRKLSCKEIDVSALIDEAVKASMMFFEGGGVTLTGGEPTVQFEAVYELLKGLKKHKIHTAMETNAHHKRLPELFDLIDYLIIDFKHYDNSKHKEVIGCDVEVTKQNIKMALEKRNQLLIRIPLINRFNSSKFDANAFADFFEEFNTYNCSFELLRYHEYGKDKWKQCALEYKMEDAYVSDEDFNYFLNIFNSKGLKIIST